MSLAASLDRPTIERIVRQVVRAQIAGASSAPAANGSATGYQPKLVVSISARHCHLTDEHVEILFGPGHRLTPEKWLYQDGFYAAAETVMVVGPRRRMLPTVRVLGPTRPRSQVELAFTDAVRGARWNWHLPTPFRWGSMHRSGIAGRSTEHRAACWLARRGWWS